MNSLSSLCKFGCIQGSFFLVNNEQRNSPEIFGTTDISYKVVCRIIQVLFINRVNFLFYRKLQDRSKESCRIHRT